MLKKISVISLSIVLSCGNLCMAAGLDTSAFGSNISGALNNVDLGSLSNASIDIGKVSSGAADLSTGSVSLDSSALNAGGVSLDASSAKSDTKISSGALSSSGTNTSSNQFGSAINMDDLSVEMPTLEGMDTNLDLGQYLQKQSELTMPDMDSLRSTLSDSMKENATLTLQNSFGEKFKDLNADLFGISNMPEVSFESLNVQYASMISEFEKHGYGKNFELGTLPQGKSTQDTVSGLDTTLGKIDLSADSEYQKLQDQFKKEGYGKDYNLSMPDTGHSITSNDAVDVFNKKYGGLQSGVETFSIPDNFNPSLKALKYSNEAKTQSYADYYYSDAYSSFTDLSGLAGASSAAKKNATKKMSMSDKAVKSSKK